MLGAVWERVVGQPDAVELLCRAAARPSHAYLLAGPPGSGLEEAARCFAAALVCPDGGCGECGHCTRALRGRHPDVAEVAPEGSQIRVEQAEEIVERSSRTPVESARKVVMILEAERMNDQVANKLLKTFEEPSASTVFLLLTSAPDELPDTVRSRCQTVVFGALAPDAVADALVAGGTDPQDATRAARLAGGRLDRARLLTGEYRALCEAFAAVPGRVDGTGGAVARAVDGVLAAVEDAFAALKERHAEETAELDAEIERGGYPDRAAARLRKVLTERHRRVEGRARVEAITEGLTVLEAVYRDALVAPATPYHPGLAPLGLSTAACLAALDAVASTRRAVQDGITLNWGLQLERLLLALPEPAGPAMTTR
jgi:DNA polymerase-3 subunit delta'